MAVRVEYRWIGEQPVSDEDWLPAWACRTGVYQFGIGDDDLGDTLEIRVCENHELPGGEHA